MSVNDELTRLQQAKDSLKLNINSLGGNLTNEKLDSYADAIRGLSKPAEIYYQKVNITDTGEGVTLRVEHSFQKVLKVFLLFGRDWTGPGGYATITYFYCGGYDFESEKQYLMVSEGVSANFQCESGAVRIILNPMGTESDYFQTQASVLVVGVR